MLAHIPGILKAEQVHILQQKLNAAAGAWTDGRVTAGYQGVRVKNNLQIAEGSALAAELGDLVVRALECNPSFISAVLPNRIYPPMFNRYEPGMEFGNHVDGAVRLISGTGAKIRTDVSATLFLAAPEDYEGGELLIEDTYGAHSIKLPAGDLIAYPATSVHRVAPVTRGARIASFFWVQSLVRDDGHRTLLFDLDNAIQRLNAARADEAACMQLAGCYHNLLRMWSTP